MKKYIVITALLLGNITWAMETKKDAAQITSPHRNGWAIIDDLNKHSGILPKKTAGQDSSMNDLKNITTTKKVLESKL